MLGAVGGGINAATTLEPEISKRIDSDWRGKKLIVAGISAENCAPCDARIQASFKSLEAKYNLSSSDTFSIEPAGADPTTGAQEVLSVFLTARPDNVIAVVSSGDETVVGAVNAVNAAKADGRIDDVLGVSSGGDAVSRTALRDSSDLKMLVGAIDYQPYQEGWNWVEAASAAAPAPSTSSVERTVRRKPLDILLDYGIYVALLALIVWFSIASPCFLTYRNLLNVGLAVSITGIVAAAITVGLIAGQLDLSIGSVLGLSAVATALGIQIWGLPLLVAALIGLLAGLVVGVVNGFLIVNIGINSIIVTLAMALTVNGVAEMLTSGQVVSITNLTLQGIVNSRPLGVPMPFIAMVIVFALGYVLLTRTKPGWHIYAVGGNSTAALRSGIKVNRIYRNLFLLTGIAAAVAGLITAGRAGGGGPSLGQGAEFDVLTAVLLGGIGLSGGAGRIERTLLGVLIIGALNNGLTLLSVDSYVQDTARGASCVLAVVLGAIATKRSAR